MRFIWTFIWALLISSVASYVLTSMGGSSFNMLHTLALAIIVSIAVILLGEGVLKSEEK